MLTFDLADLLTKVTTGEKKWNLCWFIMWEKEQLVFE